MQSADEGGVGVEREKCSFGQGVASSSYQKSADERG